MEKITIHNKSKNWGIDLNGRTMWYEPWPVDINKKYRHPTEKEIEKIYGISGDAVKETLLYFETCVKNELTTNTDATEVLITLLNTHVYDPEYSISRDELLDTNRWYNNEYYFYFIMFTKKVLGRYDFHFGEGSNKQLSVYHKIFEQDLTNTSPWNPVDKSQLVFSSGSNLYKVFSSVKDLNSKKEIKTGLLKFIKDAFNISINNFDLQKKITDEKIWIIPEFLFFTYNIFQVLTNNQNIIYDISLQLHKYPKAVKILARSVMSQKLIYKSQRVVTRKLVTLKYNFSSEKNDSGYITIDYNIIKNHKFIRSMLDNSLKTHIAAYRKAVPQIFNQKRNSIAEVINIDYEKLKATIYIKWRDHSTILSPKTILLFIFTYPLLALPTLLFTPITPTNTLQYSLLYLILIYFILRCKKLNKNASEFQMNLDENRIFYNQEIEYYKNINVQLSDYSTNLEQKVQSRTAKLNTAYKKLSELDKAKTAFFTNISHELRTPLTLIRTNLGAIRKGLFKPKEEIIETMYRNSDKLLSLISTLLDFSKIESGRLSLTLENHELSTLISESLSAVASTAEQLGFHLHTQISKPLYAAIDRNFFEKAFFNLVSNAFKFTKPGGTITIILEQKNKKILISVMDTGIGIADEKLDIIFDRFRQIDSSNSRKYAGTGIGLAFAKEIVELHKGTITVNSHEGKGSTFTITLDAVDIFIEEKSEVVSDQNQVNKIFKSITLHDNQVTLDNFESLTSGNNMRDIKTHTDLPLILIVEDTDDMRILLTSLLIKKYRTQSAVNGKEALYFLETTDTLPDLILSDVMMPQMDGYEMITALRKNSDYESIPIILLTAKAAPQNYLEGFNAGAIDYIIKPFNAEELLSRIAAQLKMKQLRDKLQHSNTLLYKQIETLMKGKGLSSDLEAEQTPQPDGNSSHSKKIDIVETFLQENFMYDISREGIAAKVGLSPDYMSRLYSQYKGLKMFDYLRDLRLDNAATMLKSTKETITTIAYQSGFDNARTFNRQFKKRFNLSPHEYRERY